MSYSDMLKKMGVHYEERDPLVEEIKALNARMDRITARFDGLTALLKLLIYDEDEIARFEAESAFEGEDLQ